MKNIRKTLRMMLSTAVLAGMLYSLPAAADTYVVKNANDGGRGSLRHMINAANGHVGLDTIAFNIPGAGVHTITVESELPEITDPVIIDGYTQPGSSANTLKVGNDASLMIVLDGTNAPSTVGLHISAGQCIVRGLVINNFLPRYANWGVGIFITGKGGNRIEGCFIGTDYTGAAAAPNQIGVEIVASPNNMVGGVAARSRNVISGNYNAGIHITDFVYPDLCDQADGNQIRGNYIGLDAQGQKALSQSTEFGVSIDGVSNTTIGGTVAGAGNVISGNSDGIRITGGSVAMPSENKVQGNYIGVDATGTKAIFNYNGINFQAQGENNVIGGTTAGARNVISGNGTGIYLIPGSPDYQTRLKIQGNYIGSDVTGTAALRNDAGIYISSAPGNLIGGTEAGAGNLIAFNGIGIDIDGYNDHGINNAILSNSIHSNDSLGINLEPGYGVTPNDAGDADEGANHLQNFPVLSTASVANTGTTVQGRLQSTPSTTFTIQFFANSSCDPSGYGEGERFIGSKTVTTNSDGKVWFRVQLPPVPGGESITATATDPNGNTSEFSACVTVAEASSTSVAAS